MIRTALCHGQLPNLRKEPSCLEDPIEPVSPPRLPLAVAVAAFPGCSYDYLTGLFLVRAAFLGTAFLLSVAQHTPPVAATDTCFLQSAHGNLNSKRAIRENLFRVATNSPGSGFQRCTNLSNGRLTDFRRSNPPAPMMDYYWRPADRITHCGTAPSDHPPFQLAPVHPPGLGQQGAGTWIVDGMTAMALAPSEPSNGDTGTQLLGTSRTSIHRPPRGNPSAIIISQDPTCLRDA